MASTVLLRAQLNPRSRLNTPPLHPPPPKDASEYSVLQRVQVLTLLVEGFSSSYIHCRTGVPERVQRYTKKKAIERGWNFTGGGLIHEEYVVDGKRTGAPKKITAEMEQALLDNVRKDRNGREKSSEVLAYEAGISSASTLRILQKHGLSSVKPTTKPGLNAA